MGLNVMVGIPAYNEESAIESVIAGSIPHATSVIVVDDGSSDQTSAFALRAGATVIRHTRNSGKGLAVATLFDYAIKEHADILVLLDGDGQHDPDEIPRLVNRCLDQNVDVVVGSRFRRGSSSDTPHIRRVGQLVFNTLTHIASGVPCSDSQSGFRAFSRRAICAMRLSEVSFSVESEMQFECRARSLTLDEVPISCKYNSPPKRNVLSHGMIVLAGLVTMALKRRTLHHNPEFALPQAQRTVLQSSRSGDGQIFNPAIWNTPGD